MADKQYERLIILKGDDSLEIDGISFATDNAALSLKVGVAVTKLSMDSTEQNSQDLVRMMEQSVNPNIGRSIDVRV
jgi:hypothetical protein